MEATPDRYKATAQKGTPGHCYAAQVFKDGKAFLMIEPTENEIDATRDANHVANCLNRIEVTRLQAENKRLRDALEGLIDQIGNEHCSEYIDKPLDLALSALKKTNP